MNYWFSSLKDQRIVFRTMALAAWKYHTAVWTDRFFLHRLRVRPWKVNCVCMESIYCKHIIIMNTYNHLINKQIYYIYILIRRIVWNNWTIHVISIFSQKTSPDFDSSEARSKSSGSSVSWRIPKRTGGWSWDIIRSTPQAEWDAMRLGMGSPWWRWAKYGYVKSKMLGLRGKMMIDE